MSALLLVAFAAVVVVSGLMVAFARICLEDLVSEEVRTRLDQLPYTMVVLAARRTPIEVRSDLAEEWTAELAVILSDTAGLPLTRLCRGTRYAAGLLRTARGIGRQLTAERQGDRRRTLARIAHSYLQFRGAHAFASIVSSVALSVVYLQNPGGTFLRAVFVIPCVVSLFASVPFAVSAWRLLREARRPSPERPGRP